MKKQKLIACKYSKYLIYCTLSIIIQQSYAQNFSINGGYHGFLDNREYFNKYDEHQTFLGNRLFFFVSAQTDKDHSLNLGTDYTYEFGSEKNAYKPKLIANYEYNGSKINFIFGTFHRHNIIMYPNIMLSDSLNYYRPLIEGTRLKYKYNNGYQQLWLDWTGRQTDSTRESFLAGISGSYTINNFHFYNNILMYHHAKTKNNVQNYTIRDNGGASLMVGYAINISGFINTVFPVAGEFFSYDRQRGVYDIRTYYSTMFGCNVAFRNHLEFNAHYITGDGQVMLYGEKIYRAKDYARFSFGYRPFYNKYPYTFFEFCLHLVDGEIDYSQMINVFISFNKKIPERNLSGFTE